MDEGDRQSKSSSSLIKRKEFVMHITLSSFAIILINLLLSVSASPSPPHHLHHHPLDSLTPSPLHPRGCPDSYKKFEIMSGFALNSPSDAFYSIPGCLEMSSCLAACRGNDSCLSVNFETGLCVLLSSSATLKPSSLKESQFPVFTIYAQKVCLSDYGKCNHSRKRRKKVASDSTDWVTWVYERVPGHQLALLDSLVSTTTGSPPTTNFDDQVMYSTTTEGESSSSQSPSDDHWSSLPGDPSSPPPQPIPLFAITSPPPSSSSPPVASPLTQPTEPDDDLSFLLYRHRHPSSPSHPRLPDPPTTSYVHHPHHRPHPASVSQSQGRHPHHRHPHQNQQFVPPSSSSFEDPFILDDSEDALYSLLTSSLHPDSTNGPVGHGRLGRSLSEEADKTGKSFRRLTSPGKKKDILLSSSWTTQRVLEVHVSSLLRCAEACLQEVSFPCLSANFDRATKRCILMSFDRHSLSADSEALKLPNQEKDEMRKTILRKNPSFDYIEMNCRSQSNLPEKHPSEADFDDYRSPSQGQLMCDFRPLPGVILKTVDAIFEDVNSISECKKKCLEAPFQCYSFDLGDESSLDDGTTPESAGVADVDPSGGHLSYDDWKKKTNKKRVKNGKRTQTASILTSRGPSSYGPKKAGKKSVCRISHLDRSSMSHLKDPYTKMPGVTTYERNNCFGISVSCGSQSMKASFHSVKPFTGKIYSVRAPTTCQKGLDSRTSFNMHIPFFSAQSTIVNKNRTSQVKMREFSDCGVSASSVRGGRHQEDILNGLNNGTKDDEEVEESLSKVLAREQEPRLLAGKSGMYARFSVSLVMQRHSLIVTSSDFDITLNCDYDLSQQKIVSNSIQLLTHPMEDLTHLEEITAASPNDPKRKPIPGQSDSMVPSGSSGIGSIIPASPSGAPFGDGPLTHEATFHSPIVRMSITDRAGGPVRAAEVGDPLSLRFEVTDESGKVESMYDVFVKHIFADDGVDNSELELIDGNGCPTDPSIMGPLRKVPSANGAKILEAPFEAFKFPTSAIVQFRALIVPCIAGDCQPVVCHISPSMMTSSNLAGHPTFNSGSKTTVHSFGKRSVDADEVPLDLSSMASMFLPMVREVEERVFIEVLEKRKDPQPEPERVDNNKVEPLDEPKKSIDAQLEDQDDRVMQLPFPWIILSACILCVQLILLLRCYFSTRKTSKNLTYSTSRLSSSSSSSSSHHHRSQSRIPRRNGSTRSDDLDAENYS